MDEHTFPSGLWAVDDAKATSLVAEMAESILDKISRPDHDWRVLHGQAAGLHAVSSLMVVRYGRRGGGD